MSFFHFIMLLGASGGLPTFVPYLSSDVFLFVYGLSVISFVAWSRDILLACVIIIGIIISKILIMSIYNSEYSLGILRYVGGDFRIFFIFTIISGFRDQIKKIIPYIFAWHFFLYSGFNFIGEYNSSHYKAIQYLWNVDHLNYGWLERSGIYSTIAGHAAPMRLSGHFPLPSYAGIFMVSAAAHCLYRVLFIKSSWPQVIFYLFCLLMTFYFGFRSNSTIFSIGVFLVFGVLILFRFPHASIFIFTPLIMLFFVYFYTSSNDWVRFFFGGRFSEGSNVSLLINYILNNNIIMLGSLSDQIPFFVSDNMVLIRIFSYGVVGALVIYVLSSYLLGLVGGFNNPLYFSFTLIFFLAELGVRAVAAPEVYLLVILVLMWNSSGRKYSLSNKVNYNPPGDL